jgi:hypothetical protein
MTDIKVPFIVTIIFLSFGFIGIQSIRSHEKESAQVIAQTSATDLAAQQTAWQSTVEKWKAAETASHLAHNPSVNPLPTEVDTLPEAGSAMVAPISIFVGVSAIGLSYIHSRYRIWR